MIFESKYRRQAMEHWVQSREETKRELLVDIQNHLTSVTTFGQWLKRRLSAVIGQNKHIY